MVTSRQTAFSVKFLYQISLDVLYMYGSFSAVAKKYTAYHLGNFSDAELDSARNSDERQEGEITKIQMMIELMLFLFSV